MFTIREVTAGLITFTTIVFEPILSPQDHHSHSENQVEKTSIPYISVDIYQQGNARKLQPAAYYPCPKITILEGLS
jgi:hypothetical protein